MIFSVMMVILATPVLLAIKEDFYDINYDVRVIIAPLTLAWACLVPTLISVLVKAKKGWE